MGFNVNLTTEDTQEAASPLQEPVIAEAELDFLGSDEIGSNEEYSVINMKWIMQDEDHMGQTFNHVEWQPREQDFQSVDGRDPQIKDEMRRLLHVLSRVTTVDKDQVRVLLNDVSGDTIEEYWENVRTVVDQLMSRNERTDVTYEIKVVGNDYKGGSLQFPRYPSFVRVVGEDPALSFNDYDKKQNAAYRQLQNEEPDDDTSFDFGSEDVDDDFDF